MIRLLLFLIPIILVFSPGFIRLLDGGVSCDGSRGRLCSAVAYQKHDRDELGSWSETGSKLKGSDGKHTSFGAFDVSVHREGLQSKYSVVVRKDAKVLYRGESYFSMPEIEVMDDFPEKGCSTLLTYCFSGGAHCCMTGILCTECGGEGNLSVVDLSNLEEFIMSDADAGDGWNISVIDYQFAYYQAGNPKLWFPYSMSPVMERLLLYKGGGWSVDRPGEKKSFYEKLLSQNKCEVENKLQNELSGEDDLELAATAIECSYYELMAGKNDDDARGLLEEKLPNSWKPEAAGIFKDIKKSVFEFDPVKRIR